MKVAAILLSSFTVSSETTVESGNFNPDYSDYPNEGSDLNAQLNLAEGVARSGGRKNSGEGVDPRKIYARKRLINSQIITDDRKAWYYHYHDYGCYCVAPSAENKNRGKPVDAIDSVCKTHSLCYACAFSDFSSDTECDPKATGYKYKILAKSNPSAEDAKFEISCLNSKNSCQYAACMCDKKLAEDLGQMVRDGVLADKEFRNYDGENCGAQKKQLFVPARDQSATANFISAALPSAGSAATSQTVSSGSSSGFSFGGNSGGGANAAESVEAADSFVNTFAPVSLDNAGRQDVISPVEAAGIFHDDASSAIDFESELSIVTQWTGEAGADVVETPLPEKKCCGVYPQRFPYKTGGNKECCDVGKSTEELKPLGTC